MAKDQKGHGSNPRSFAEKHAKADRDALNSIHMAGEQLRRHAAQFPGAKFLYDRAIKKNDKMEAAAAKRAHPGGRIRSTTQNKKY